MGSGWWGKNRDSDASPQLPVSLCPQQSGTEFCGLAEVEEEEGEEEAQAYVICEKKNDSMVIAFLISSIVLATVGDLLYPLLYLAWSDKF